MKDAASCVKSAVNWNLIKIIGEKYKKEVIKNV